MKTKKIYILLIAGITSILLSGCEGIDRQKFIEKEKKNTSFKVEKLKETKKEKLNIDSKYYKNCVLNYKELEIIEASKFEEMHIFDNNGIKIEVEKSNKKADITAISITGKKDKKENIIKEIDTILYPDGSGEFTEELFDSFKPLSDTQFEKIVGDIVIYINKSDDSMKNSKTYWHVFFANNK